jgi:DNA polymerase-1
MFRIFSKLDTDLTSFSNCTKIGLAKGIYQDKTLIAISYQKDNEVISDLFSEKNFIGNSYTTPNQVFTWNSDIDQFFPNILDISLMCYQHYNIVKPKFTKILTQQTKYLYDNSQINILRHVIKKDNLIPYYITEADLCEQSKIYLQLGDDLYSQFDNRDKQFYHHLLRAKRVLKKIRNNQIFINKSYLLNYLRKADNKYQRIGKQILERIKDKKIIQHLDITGTITGRLAGTGGLNLQTLPKGAGLKRCIVSRFQNGQILVADWNAMEFRIALAEAEYVDLTKTDIHTRTAQQIFQKENISFEEREQAKTINFSIIYSGFVNKNAGIIKRLYPMLNDKVQAITIETKRTKKQINIFGRKRIFANDTLFQTKSFNNLIQGSAADVCLRALYLIQGEIEKQQLKSKIILAVHDSIIFDCKKNEINTLLKVIQDIMTNKALPSLYKQRLLFPVAVVAGNNYEDLKPLATIYKDEIR